MSSPEHDAYMQQVWSGINFAYGGGVAGIFVVALGLYGVNYPFRDTTHIDPAQSAIAIAADPAFAPWPDEAVRVHVSSPFRDFDLTCEIATWSPGQETLTVAWCPEGRLDTAYGNEEVHQRLFDLAHMDAVEPDGRASIFLTTLGTAAGVINKRSFSLSRGTVHCVDFVHFVDSQQGAREPAYAGSLLFGQACLAGSQDSAHKRQQSLLAGLTIEGWEGALVRPQAE